DLFECETVEALARAIDSSATGGGERAASAPFDLVPAELREQLPEGIEDAYPLSRLQAGMIYHSEMESGSAVYHDLFSFELAARWDEPAFAAALAGLIERHPALRTSFLAAEGGWVQLVRAPAAPRIAVRDIAGLPEAEQEAQLAQWFEAERRTGFDWGEGAPMRFFVFERGAERFQFGLSFHHAILDGWSVATLLTELFGDYSARLRDTPLRLEAPRSLYRDFVALEQEAVAS